MKFVIEHISKSSGRIGHIVQTDKSTQFKTPLLLQTTKGGSIPYLSREVFNYITQNVEFLEMTLATMDQMAESLSLFKGTLSEYVGYKNYPTAFIIRDPSENMPSGHNDKDIVPLFTRRGKVTVTAKRYMDLMETFAPDIYQGLSDADTNIDSTKKRIKKSVDRTENFMDYCYERHLNSEKLQNSALFAPITGGYSTFARSQSIKHTKSSIAEKASSGYILEGFHNYGLSATEVNEKELLPVMEHCVKEMDVQKPIMMPGAYSPTVVLELIRLGVDMFDTSYAYCAAVNFKALSFNFNLTSSDSIENCGYAFIDLTDESLKHDFTPILKDCSCLACKKHTRGYVHHLYKTKELLGPILLIIHNLHHYMQFFEVIRECIGNDNLNDLIKLVKYQTLEHPVDYCISKNSKIITQADFGKGISTAK